MAIPSLREVASAGGYRLKFKPSNAIPYMMDHQFLRGLPSGVTFYIAERDAVWCKLVAGGYGVAGEYGNGAVYVSRKHVPGGPE